MTHNLALSKSEGVSISFALINLNGKATYLVSLKDNAGLVKMYAFVDVQNYQRVVVTDANLGILKAKENYLKNIGVDTTSLSEKETIKIKTINQVNIDGNTYYYIETVDNNKYKVSIKVNEDLLPFLKVGEEIVIYHDNSETVREITKIE